MVTSELLSLRELYESDETAWLEAMAELVSRGAWDEIDAINLSEYLLAMAKRDRREVLSRLAILIAHLLKWQFQPNLRTRSWQTTIEIQRQELLELLESGTLRNYASEILDKAYANGLRQTLAETGLPESTFASDCPWSLDWLLSEPLEQ